MFQQYQKMVLQKHKLELLITVGKNLIIVQKFGKISLIMQNVIYGLLDACKIVFFK